MTTRITRATFTVVSVAALVLLGLFLCSLNAGRANAQRIKVQESVPSDFSVEAPAPVAPGTQYHATLPPRSDQTPSLPGQPYEAPSAALMQPIVVAIKEGPQLRGEPVALGTLPIKTVFGPVSIPVNQIAGIRTADDARQPATICLSNGDSLTGVLSTDSITIKTEWGTATIARDHIASIVTTSEPVTWQQHEGRWRIIPVETVTRAADTADTNVEVGEKAADAKPAQLDFPALEIPRQSGSVPTDAAAPSSKY